MGTNTINCPKCGSSNFYSVSDNVIRCQYCGSNIFIEQQPGPSQVQQKNPYITLSDDMDVLDTQGKDYQLASNGQRFVNFIVDRITSYFLLFLVIGLAGDGPNGGEYLILLAFLMIPLYYILLEGYSGKTLGKLISRTRAVNEDGSKLGYGTAFVRTICRIIPFEPFSILFSNGVCWHDSIPKTRVIQDK